MRKDFNTLNAGRNKINLMKMDVASINAWLIKNSKILPTKKNEIVGISECPAPWG